MELLIVIVVIGILAAITVVAFNGVQSRARDAKIDSDLAMIEKALSAARVNKSTTLFGVLADGGTEVVCVGHPTGTNLAILSQTDGCWTRYVTALNLISDASGMNIRGLLDPWGRPYLINANEDENQTTHRCLTDRYGVYTQPFVTGSSYKVERQLPLWKSPCA